MRHSMIRPPGSKLAMGLRAGVALGVTLGVAVATTPAHAAEKARAAKPTQAPAASAPTEEWAATAVTKETGEFDYCAVGARFANDHALLIARNRADEIVVIVGLPDSKLNPKSLLPTKLTIDQRFSRQGSALATRPTAMAISLGKDPEFLDAVRRGNTLAISNSATKLTLSLRGSAGALGDLNDCVATVGKSVANPVTVASAPPLPNTMAAPAAMPETMPEPVTQTVPEVPAQDLGAAPAPTSKSPAVESSAAESPATSSPPDPSPAVSATAAESPAQAPPAVSVAALPPREVPTASPAVAPQTVLGAPPGPALPDPLVNLLSAAGMAGIVPVSLDRVPPDQRPANYAWKYGAVFGGIREVSIIDSRGLAELTDAYVEILKNSCGGQFTSSMGPIESLREITLRIGEASCALPERTTEFRHVYYINKARIFTTFIHESDSANKAMAVKARDQLTGVIRQLATAGAVSH
ncbi:hypothetical protein N825_27830 [Skermanella stibiiresistens SB22]|uniref:Uncharacterized protein n=1 Tax=Skermanella stibiiresistens SB22 TaxID=1385369 RepID=W9HC98_9PROT|nr:hypothetical protein [Skermanella stibiiresistens]EWY41508.1 hypothetical protein N825_27830 [Skermanella stibiiresistens SB22]